MDGYREIANARYFELAESLQTTCYWSAAYVASTWLHKISMDDRWK